MTSNIGGRDADFPDKISNSPISGAKESINHNENTNKRNAFSELMSPKAKQSKQLPAHQSEGKLNNLRDPRNGLGAYLLDPSNFSSDVVIHHTDNAVLIRDAFPKATVHLLLLPRDSTKWNLNPRDAFDDPVFLDTVRNEAAESVKLGAAELSRIIGPYSQSNQARITAMESDDPPSELPPGRDFSKDFRVGIHAHPSMNHLHVHIISRDMRSDRLKHQKHYNSFNTDFFIPLEDFPMAKDDPRRQTSYQNANLKKEYKCWRCSKNFGNKFTQLKAHLEEEYGQWRSE